MGFPWNVHYCALKRVTTSVCKKYFSRVHHDLPCHLHGGEKPLDFNHHVCDFLFTTLFVQISSMPII
jgi:hypothetical protein